MKIMNRKGALVIAIIFYVVTISYNHRWSNNFNTISQDPAGYYAYLPGILIYHDLSFKFLFDKSFVERYVKSNKYPPETWYLNTAPNGNAVPKYPIGVAVLNAPFFLTAHYLAILFGFDDTGYSMIFKIMYIIANLSFTIWGIITLGSVLKNYFSEKVVFVVLLTVTLATNMFFYSTVAIGMSHLYSFCFFALLLKYTIAWHRQPLRKYAIYIGALLGMIALLRVTNIIVCLIPLLYNVKSWKDVSLRIDFFKKHFGQMMLMLLFFVIGLLPQLLFWKVTTGSWVFYSYSKERFYFLDPKILPGLFSFRSGWLMYTPIMTFALIGFVTLRKRLPEFFVPILMFFLLNIYVIFSWWSWWYGLSFSIRPMLESYVFLSLPLATFVSFLFEKRERLSGLVYGVLAFFIVFNIFQTIQHQRGIIKDDRMNFKAYVFAFGKLKYTDQQQREFDKLIDQPHHNDGSR